MIETIKEIWDYREMIVSLVRRELRGKYEKSVLGFVWAFLGPFFQILIYSIVFTVVFHNNIENYLIYLMVGMFPWNFFSDSLAQGTGAIIGNAEMVKKIYFPREVLVISEVTANAINMLLSFIMLVIAILIYRVGFSVHLVMLPVAIIIEYMWTLGLALIAASLTVYLRDLQYVINVILMAWVWGTPVMYSTEGIITPLYLTILRLNPMTYMIRMYRDIFYYHTWIAPTDLLIAFCCGVAALVVGALVFKGNRKRFAEEM